MNFPWYHSYEFLIPSSAPPPVFLSLVAGQPSDTNAKARFHSIHPIYRMRNDVRVWIPYPISFQVIEADTLKLEFVTRFSIHNSPLYARRPSPRFRTPFFFFSVYQYTPCLDSQVVQSHLTTIKSLFNKILISVPIL